MATYVITDRKFNVQATRSAKDVLKIVSEHANMIIAQIQEPVEAETKAQPVLKEVELNITVKGREVMNNGELIGQIEGLRDPSGKEERHIPYLIRLENGKCIGIKEGDVCGRFAYQKELLKALNEGELNEELKAALAEPVEEETGEEGETVDGVKVTMVRTELTLGLLRNAIYNEHEVLLFKDDSEEWAVKVNVFH